MMNKERDQFDDLFRSKLQDFEVDTLPGDWEAIADRLPGKKVVSFRQTLRYWGAAAVILLLFTTGGLYLFHADEESMAVEIPHPTLPTSVSPITPIEPISERQMEEPVASIVPNSPVKSMKTKRMIAQASEKDKSTAQVIVQAQREEEGTETEQKTSAVETANKTTSDNASQYVANIPSSQTVEATPTQTEKKTPIKRWGFGMGGGSITAGTTNSLSTYAFKNTMMADFGLEQLNSPYFNEESPKTNIHHKTPVSIGMGVSYYLNNRFALQSGLTYTFLSSSWETNGSYHSETTQKLHFIGIPLSLSYKIAEWERIQFYAAAGAMAEVNVAGKLNSKIFVGDDEIAREKSRVRMHEWLWSVNARVGASYPLLRFLSIYAEAGAGYYFDNGSDIETIRSDKPFNVNLQAGFRFGF